jgi:DNA-binding transcriptional LysR family regulator
MAELADWTLVRSFLAVLRGGSLSAAARRTAQTQPTIGRHIDQLEAALGIALFTRSPGGLLPTEAALRLRPHAEAVEGAMAAIGRAAAARTGEAGLAGVVRISASEVMGAAVLPAILAELRQCHPAIVIELALNNRNEDLLRRDADIAVRMRRPQQEGLSAQKVGVLGLGLYAHRRYLARFGAPSSVDELKRFHVIGFDRDDHSARAVAKGLLPIDRSLFAFRCDNDAAQMEAVRAGLGIGVMQIPLGHRDPDLVPVLSDAVRFELEVWLTIHADLKDEPVIRAALDVLARGLRAHLRAAQETGARTSP